MIFSEIILHDFSKPLRARLEQRKVCGPYHWTPSEPGKGRGFYMSSRGLACAEHGAGFDLRLELANDHLRETRQSQTLGYYCDEYHDETFTPIVARLPRGRGFLAGWTMGAGMCASIAGDVYSDAASAAWAAHCMAERDAENERDYQHEESARLEAETREAEGFDHD